MLTFWQANEARYYKLDPKLPLGPQLAGKNIIEFPILTVLLPGEASDPKYRILGPPTDPPAVGRPPLGPPAAGPGSHQIPEGCAHPLGANWAPDQTPTGVRTPAGGSPEGSDRSGGVGAGGGAAAGRPPNVGGTNAGPTGRVPNQNPSQNPGEISCPQGRGPNPTAGAPGPDPARFSNPHGAVPGPAPPAGAPNAWTPAGSGPMGGPDPSGYQTPSSYENPSVFQNQSGGLVAVGGGGYGGGVQMDGSQGWVGGGYGVGNVVVIPRGMQAVQGGWGWAPGVQPVQGVQYYQNPPQQPQFYGSQQAPPPQWRPY